MLKSRKIQRLEATVAEPLAFLPTFFGLAGVTMPADVWARVGYSNLPQIATCACAFCVGIAGYWFRWRQRSHPSEWSRYIKYTAFLYCIFGITLLLEGSGTGAVLFSTYLLQCRKEIVAHCLFTKSRRITNVL